MQPSTLEKFKNSYWLKLQLINFCKQSGLSTAGSKKDLEQRIEVFLSSGNKIKPESNKQTGRRDSYQPLTRDTLVVNYKNDTATRLFFIEHSGKHFRFDAYLRQFTNQNNITKNLTYGDLVDGWLKAESQRSDPNYQTRIGEQFEYNQFTRDYFANENGKTQADAIKAWTLVKALPGEKTYANYLATRSSRIEIKPYIDVYQDEVVNLIYKIQAEFDLPMTVEDQPDVQQISKHYQIGCGNFWAAFHKGLVIGTIGLIDIGNHQAALRKMFVDKNYRGKEMGVAKSLLCTLVDWCKANEIRDIYLGTRSMFLAAHQFYQKNGFDEISKNALPGSFVINPVDSKFYLKSVSIHLF